jgi:hypothetical protein
MEWVRYEREAESKWLMGDRVGWLIAKINAFESNPYNVVGGYGGVKKVGKKAAEKVTKTIRVRHYTNSKGARSIREEGVIRASDQNKVFAERARGKPLSARDAERRYRIGRGRGNHIVETDVPADRVNRVYNPKTKTDELQIEGDVPLVNPSFPR